MSEFFRDWSDAHRHAEEKANRLGLDVAIRATKEYGKKGFAVHLASRNDSDYALAEIVKPAAGKEWKRNPGKRNPVTQAKWHDMTRYGGRGRNWKMMLDTRRLEVDQRDDGTWRYLVTSYPWTMEAEGVEATLSQAKKTAMKIARQHGARTIRSNPARNSVR